MLSMLIAYDDDGNVVATLDHMVAQDEDGNVIGLVDFEAHESAGGKLREVWQVTNAAGSCTWPEWLGSAAHGFKVEKRGTKVVALRHRESGHRRSRKAVNDAIKERTQHARLAATADGEGAVADIRDLVGGPGRPLLLDAEGRTIERPKRVATKLPVMRTA